MGKLLLITGDIASGKSTFAEILSGRYQVNVFCKDKIKEILGDTIGFMNREENLKLSKATMELMIFLFSQFVKTKGNLILEANFREKELERFHQIASDNHYEILTLVLRGDIGILHKRYLNRMHNENRHPVHLSTTIDIFEDFKNCTDHLRKENVPGNTVFVDANDFSYQTDEKLLSNIDEFMIRGS